MSATSTRPLTSQDLVDLVDNPKNRKSTILNSQEELDKVGYPNSSIIDKVLKRSLDDLYVPPAHQDKKQKIDEHNELEFSKGRIFLVPGKNEKAEKNRVYITDVRQTPGKDTSTRSDRKHKRKQEKKSAEIQSKFDEDVEIRTLKKQTHRTKRGGRKTNKRKISKRKTNKRKSRK
jgi:hypothetical protein